MVNADTYKDVLKFILLYRECINEFGWEKKAFFEQNGKSVEELKNDHNYHDYSL